MNEPLWERMTEKPPCYEPDCEKCPFKESCKNYKRPWSTKPSEWENDGIPLRGQDSKGIIIDHTFDVVGRA